MNNIEKSMMMLEMSHKYFVDMVKSKCICGHEKSLQAKEHKKSCPCHKPLSFFGEQLETYEA